MTALELGVEVRAARRARELMGAGEPARGHVDGDRDLARGLTQADLAMAARTGVRFVGDLERGKETCRLGETLRVLAALGLDVRLEPRGR